MPANPSLEWTGRFLRFSGHPDLTIRSCHHGQTRPRTTYRYSREIKATAVRLSQLPGVAVGDVAESLYIHPFMLSLWRKQAREGLIMTKGVAVDKEVVAELKALRKVKKAYEQLND
ncbi:MAG: transposase [Xanthomonadales bacterium]|nr:transposase [Xanthomonadales bacterium]